MPSKLDRDESLFLLFGAITRLKNVSSALSQASHVPDVSKFYADLDLELVTLERELKIDDPGNLSGSNDQLEKLLFLLEKICKVC